MIKKLLLILFFCGCIGTTDYSHILVTKVIDGDTVILANGEHLRYLGIDTPESRIKQGDRFVYAPQPFAKEATDLNERLVLDKVVRVEFDVEKRDKYNRLLGYCFVNNTLVNAKLVEEGFATLYTSPPNVKYTDTFIAAQKKARRLKLGLWGAYETIGPGQTMECVNQIRTVHGKVTHVKHSPKYVALRFDEGTFSIILFENSVKAFQAQGFDPLKDFTDKVVEVTGRIKEYKGRAEIVVHAPSEIEIIENAEPLSEK